MNNQEIFDKVSTHLLTQNAQSVNKIHTPGLNLSRRLSCMYRGLEGRSCAVGCLIPDVLYDRTLEGLVSDDKKIMGVLEKVGVMVSSSSLLRAVKTVHDTSLPGMWKDQLIEVAKRSNLNYDIVTNFKKTNE